jgi:hypothetical protein
MFDPIHERLHIGGALLRFKVHFFNVQRILRVGSRQPDEAAGRWVGLEDDCCKPVWVVHDLLGKASENSFKVRRRDVCEDVWRRKRLV